MGPGSMPLGGTISTVVTNRPSASLAPSRERAASGTGSIATARAGAGSVPMSNACRGDTLCTKPTIARM